MEWFKNRKTLTKLMLAFCLMSLFMAGVGYGGVYGVNSINNMIGTLYNREMKGLASIREAEAETSSESGAKLILPSFRPTQPRWHNSAVPSTRNSKRWTKTSLRQRRH